MIRLVPPFCCRGHPVGHSDRFRQAVAAATIKDPPHALLQRNTVAFRDKYRSNTVFRPQHGTDRLSPIQQPLGRSPSRSGHREFSGQPGLTHPDRRNPQPEAQMSSNSHAPRVSPTVPVDENQVDWPCYPRECIQKRRNFPEAQQPRDVRERRFQSRG